MKQLCIMCNDCLGIMQLAMLAPYNNLATSVAAALVPTLLTPKFHLAGNEPFGANTDVMLPGMMV